MEEHLFLDKYQSQTTTEWRRLVQSDLKDVDFSTLEWHASGITVQPYYTHEDAKDISYPGYIYTKKSSHQNWENLEKIGVENEVTANKLALTALNAGADGIIFDLSIDQMNLNALLQNILLQHCSIYFSGPADISSHLVTYCAEHNIDLQTVRGGLLTSSRFDNTIKLLKTFPLLSFKLLSVQANGEGEEKDFLYPLVDALLQIAEIIEKLTDQGLEAHVAFKNLIVRFKTSNSYYFEICKTRAFRLLLGGLARGFNINNFNPETVHIHHYTSPADGENKDQNMIRNTSQAMSAILGGCNSIYIAPHDLEVHSNFSRRIARNISLILKEEAYFDKVSDPAAGSYLFESLTKEITEKVWNEFITIQKEKR